LDYSLHFRFPSEQGRSTIPARVLQLLVGRLFPVRRGFVKIMRESTFAQLLFLTSVTLIHSEEMFTIPTIQEINKFSLFQMNIDDGFF
jgi:hypothetical protein